MVGHTTDSRNSATPRHRRLERRRGRGARRLRQRVTQLRPQRRGAARPSAAVAAAVKAAVDASDPVADTRGPVDFKKYVAGVIVKTAIESARSRA